MSRGIKSGRVTWKKRRGWTGGYSSGIDTLLHLLPIACNNQCHCRARLASPWPRAMLAVAGDALVNGLEGSKSQRRRASKGCYHRKRDRPKVKAAGTQPGRCSPGPAGREVERIGEISLGLSTSVAALRCDCSFARSGRRKGFIDCRGFLPVADVEAAWGSALDAFSSFSALAQDPGGFCSSWRGVSIAGESWRVACYSMGAAREMGRKSLDLTCSCAPRLRFKCAWSEIAEACSCSRYSSM